ncbi:MAG TPA: 50S ribosomal protein L29 [Candidatus Saccharimonadales bacterium]
MATTKQDKLTAASLRSMKADERVSLLHEKQTELLEKKRSLAANELANPLSIKQLRREVALILTVENEPQGEKEEA